MFKIENFFISHCSAAEKFYISFGIFETVLVQFLDNPSMQFNYRTYSF
jgi:hypothetical protein